MYGMLSSEKNGGGGLFVCFVFVIFLTMLPQVLHHLPQHQRHTIFHQAPLLQLSQGRSKQLGVLNCPRPQHGDLNHLLHVLFNQHRCLVVLRGEQISGVSHWHYGHRGQRWSQHQVRHLLACSIDFKVCGGGNSVEFIRAHFLQSCSHILRGQCVLRAERAGCAMCCYDKYQVTMQHLWLKVLLEWYAPILITYSLIYIFRWGDNHDIGI